MPAPKKRNVQSKSAADKSRSVRREKKCYLLPGFLYLCCAHHAICQVQPLVTKLRFVFFTCGCAICDSAVCFSLPAWWKNAISSQGSRIFATLIMPFVSFSLQVQSYALCFSHIVAQFVIQPYVSLCRHGEKMLSSLRKVVIMLRSLCHLLT